MKIGTLAISSLVSSFGVYYVATNSVRALHDIRFYGLLWLAWWSHIAAKLFYNIIIWPKYLSPLRHLPEPTEGRSWWNGYAKRAFFGAKGEPVAQWNRVIKNNGIFRYLDVLNTERVAVTAPDAVAEVLLRINDFEQSKTVFLLASPILGPGIVLVNGEKHKILRKQLQPTLNSKAVRDLDPIFWGKSVELLEKLTEIVDKTSSTSGFSEPISVDHYAGHVTLDGISKAALGMDFESLKHPDSELVSSYRGVFEPTTIFRMLAVVQLVFPFWLVQSLPHDRVREARTAIKLLHDVCRTSAQKKKLLQEEEKLHSPDIISSLIRDRGVSDDFELVTHSMQLLGAGHETVAVGLTWALYEFCRNAKWQDDIRSEVRANLPNPNSGVYPPKLAFEADKMPLLNAFVSESLRYWPPVAQVGRRTARDTMLKDVMIPQNTTVHISIRSFNRDPANWGSDAGQFNPERWLHRDETTGMATYVPNGNAMAKQALMSFIQGGRDCIGRVFARSEMLHVLGVLIGRLEFVLTDSTYMDESRIPVSGAGFAYKPRDNIYVHARRVPGWE